MEQIVDAFLSCNRIFIKNQFDANVHTAMQFIEINTT